MEEQKRNSGELRTWLLLAGIALILVAAGLIAFFISGGFGGVEEEVTFQVFFEKIGENIWWVLGSLAVMAAGIGILFYYNRKKDAELSRSAWTIREIAVAALCIALAFVLSYIRLWKMPNGGSVTAASMLPILLFSYIYGMRKGLLAAIAFGVLQFIQEPVFLNWMQFVLDYLLGFGVLAIAARASIPAWAWPAWRGSSAPSSRAPSSLGNMPRQGNPPGFTPWDTTPAICCPRPSSALPSPSFRPCGTTSNLLKLRQWPRPSNKTK